MRSDPGSADRKRKAYVAVAAKIAHVTHALIRSGADYRCFHEAAVPSGRTRSARAVEAIPTSQIMRGSSTWKGLRFKYREGRYSSADLVAMVECHSCCWWEPLAFRLQPRLRPGAQEIFVPTSFLAFRS